MAVIKIVPMPGAVGDKGDEGAPGAQGPQGQTGQTGQTGQDALWNYNGEYNLGAGYAVGDVVTYEGQTWYRKNSNGGNVGDTPSQGIFWDLVAAKGEPGNDVFAEDGTLYGPTNFGGLKVLGLINSGDNDLALQANDSDIYLQASSGAVTIAAPEITFTSNSVPASVNINTYLGAIINSARTSTYATEDKVVATLGDLPTGATGTFESSDSKLITVTNGIITSIESLT